MPTMVDNLREYFKSCQGKIVTLRDIRVAFNIEPGSQSDQLLRAHMSSTLVREKIVTPSGRKDGDYKVIVQVEPVRVFIPGRERRPVFELNWPIDKARGTEIPIGHCIVIREGDLIVIGGVKSSGKTTMCLNLAAVNIDKRPILMGNEYTIFTDGKYEPAPRFFNRLEIMSSWAEWTDGEGCDKFTLLPVREDYAEHVVRDRINIIDWINLEGDFYSISKVLEGIKAALGRGIGIVGIQKGENATNPRGGQFVRDFADVEIMLDPFGSENEDILFTMKGCKEKNTPIVGKTYVYSISNEGTEICNFREVRKCPDCRGTGLIKGGQCEVCYGTKYIDR